MWITESEILEYCNKTKKKSYNLYFGFAPSGFAHVGNLRVLESLVKVKSLLRTNDIKSRIVIGLADRYAFKQVNHFQEDASLLDSQLVDIESPRNGFANYFDFFLHDFLDCLKRFEIHVDEFKYFSGLYKKETLEKYFGYLFTTQEFILDLLHNAQTMPPTLYFPKCENCGKMYSSRVNQISRTWEFRYECDTCGDKRKSQLLTNNGGFSFKVESAIKFKIFEIDIQFIGMDHYDALKVSSKVSKSVFRNTRSPMVYVVNMVLDDHGIALHKSLENGRPLSSFSNDEVGEIRTLLSKTIDSTLLKLPPQYSPNSETFRK